MSNKYTKTTIIIAEQLFDFEKTCLGNICGLLTRHCRTIKINISDENIEFLQYGGEWLTMTNYDWVIFDTETNMFEVLSDTGFNEKYK